jgi:hypothetical protein
LDRFLPPRHKDKKTKREPLITQINTDFSYEKAQKHKENHELYELTRRKLVDWLIS